ncbi:MAG: hypothetical protein ETSY2_52985 [Candidatus Entotheonella gemina]|uniref:Antitoxin n=1 Tax=Candidatus Entotheonella gemina TaxID=1429439 RepID=W4L3E6_9BACT|nr:MAG: hypothetical protein ETSY2_52985 [Candidatus Entotheonella gemina]
MTKTIGLQTLSHQLNQVVGDVISEGQTYIIENEGIPAVVLLSMDEYQRLRTTIPAPEKQPAHIMSPRLANPAQAGDFELEVISEDTSHA